MTDIATVLNPSPWFKLTSDTTARSAVVHIYGTIGNDSWWDDVSSPELVPQLDALDVDEITVRVNSPGGFVSDGLAIMNALARHKAKVTATVDGLAASAATIVILGADEVHMGPGTQLMIHDAWNIAIGNAAEIAAAAARLDRTSQNIASLYAQRAGGTADEWRAAMRDETWYTAEEAVEAGLAHQVLALPSAADADASNSIPIDAAARVFGWQHKGRADASAPFIPGSATRHAPAATTASRLLVKAAPQPTAPAATATATKGDPTMSDALDQGVREALDLPTDATDEDVLARLDERLTNPAQATLPEGVVTIDQNTLDGLRSDAAAGREARTAQLTAERTATVQNAVREGRIPPARAEHWENLLAADPGAVETLNALAAGTIPLEENGITGGVDEATDEDNTYSKVFPTQSTKDGE